MPGAKFFLGTPPRASSPTPPGEGSDDKTSFGDSDLLEAIVGGSTDGGLLHKSRHLHSMLHAEIHLESSDLATASHSLKTFKAPPSPPAEARSRTTGVDMRQQEGEAAHSDNADVAIGGSSSGDGGASAVSASADLAVSDSPRVKVQRSGDAKQDGQAAIKAMLNNHKNFWATTDDSDGNSDEAPANDESFEAFTKRKIWETGPNYGNLWESDVADIRHWR
jgi:hypothetical protein